MEGLFSLYLPMNQEVWKDVKGWEGKYQISNLGRLKSFGGRYRKSMPDGYITLGCIGSSGYREVSLRRPGIEKHGRIHALVADHFLVRPYGAECVNHIDGNKLNNLPSNLEWTTMRGNCKHAVDTGLMNNRGERHKLSKLTESDVIGMRKLKKCGVSYDELAKIFGVCRRQASDVVRGVNWGHVKIGLPS